MKKEKKPAASKNAGFVVVPEAKSVQNDSSPSAPPPKATSSGGGSSLFDKWKFVLAIAIPVLYLNGYMFRMGRLGAYGIDISQFPGSINDYLIDALMAYLHALVVIASKGNIDPITVIIMFLAIGALGAFYRYAINNRGRWNKNIENAKEKWIDNEYVSGGIKWIFYAIASLSVPVYIISGIFLFCVWPHGVGVMVANSEKEKFQECAIESLPKGQNCLFVLDKSSFSVSGRLITSSDKLMAIYTSEGTRIIEIPEKGVFIPRRQ